MQDSTLQAIAYNVLDVLDRLGFVHTVHGMSWGLSFSRIMMSEDGQWLLLEIDKNRLPPRIRLEKLAAPTVRKEIQDHIGMKVRTINSFGVTFAILLEDEKALPIEVILTPDMIPNLDYPIPIGANHQGVWWESLYDTYHILVGGMTRMGKSAWLNAVLYSLLMHCKASDLDLRLIDPKMLELAYLNGIPHLHGRDVAINAQSAAHLLVDIVSEMERRQRLFAPLGPGTDLRKYNARVDAKDRLPLTVIAIDEVADLVMREERSVMHSIIRIGQIGAGLGFSLIAATQKPRHDIVSTLASGNFETRIGFHVMDWRASNMILLEPGLETLPEIAGRLMARVKGRVFTLQGVYVEPDTLVDLARTLRDGEDAPMPDMGSEALTTLYRSIAIYARDSFDGEFPINRLYQVFRNEISQRALMTLGQEWEESGLLNPASGNTARTISDELLKLL